LHNPFTPYFFMATCGYLIADPDLPGDLSAQQAAVENYAHSRGLQLTGHFTDVGGLEERLEERPEGKLLSRYLNRGDAVIFASLAHSFANPRDALVTLPAWARRGIAVHLADAEAVLDAAADQGKFLRLLTGMAAWEQARLSRLRRRTHARLRAAGAKRNKWAGFGYAWVGKGSRARRVAVPEELYICQQIVLLRSQRPPQSWHQLHRLLAYELRFCPACSQPVFPDAKRRPVPKCPTCGGRTRPFHTRTGKPWDQSRIMKAYRAHAAARQEQELATVTEE
jgi:DNA invertase Pin-like site-specific DNA recombinase